MIVRTRPYADLLEADQQALVLYEGRLLRVSALALAIIRLCETGSALGDLAAALRERFGPPAGSALEATTAAVNDLVAQGVLVVQNDAERESR